MESLESESVQSGVRNSVRAGATEINQVFDVTKYISNGLTFREGVTGSVVQSQYTFSPVSIIHICIHCTNV